MDRCKVTADSEGEGGVQNPRVRVREGWGVFEVRVDLGEGVPGVVIKTPP